MLELNFSKRPGSAFRILCLGAHSDDLEIGCGGTVLSLLEKHQDVDVRWVIFSANEERSREARHSAAAFLATARTKQVVVKSHRDGFFPFVGAAIKEDFEALKLEFEPDLVFTHFRDDRHQDHRLISDLTWNTFRDQLILEYEIPKYDGDLGQPNVFVPLTESICERKIQILLES
ncbi:MAG TPA: PIG-L deacetylase family protein, partial [Planctomycetaceae bacterium]|nr:PIG-L deacetylase family protein [Planctomycetaceae bacterium]